MKSRGYSLPAVLFSIAMILKLGTLVALCTMHVDFEQEHHHEERPRIAGRPMRLTPGNLTN